MTGRVLHLLGPSTGGIRAHVAALADGLAGRGWEVSTAGPAGVLDGLRALDHVVPVPGGASPRGVVRARRALLAIDGRWDVVHAHGLKAGWVAALAHGGAPLVISVHNLVLDDVAGRSARPLRALEAALLARADAVIAISDEVARRFTGVRGAARITTVPPVGPLPVVTRTPEAVRDSLGVPAGSPLVVTAARLHPQKGLDDLLVTAELVRRAVPDVRWIVLGEGPLRAHLEAAIDRHGLGGVVQLAGARPSVADELAAADVVAITSRWESGPLVVLEALALGRPVVSTAVGLVPDVVGPAEGAVVAVGDAPAFARAVVEALGRRAGADPVPRSAGRYGPGRLVPPVEAVYEEVLGQR